MASDMEHPRSDVFDSLCGAQFDVVIVGGGIVGAGIARDAAIRGLKTALIEQYDFASGTSSRSSRLLHGGLRYLAQGRVGLVREAGVEKSIVHGIAPHVSCPLPFIFPTYKCAPWGLWALWKLSIGVRLYDLLSGIRDFRKSRTLGRAEVTKALPGLKNAALTGAVRYYDGLTHDARLVIDSLRSAHNAGAVLLNYCRLESATPASNMWKCSVKDQLDGRTGEISAHCVINATGPWADRIEHSAVKLRLTKGVHLVVMRDRLPVPDAVVMTEGSRILFAIPWGERVILGTTDTDYDGKPEDVKVDQEDVDYILTIVNGAFPETHLTESDLVSSWAGVRPLIATPGGKPSDISRSHEIKSKEPGWWDVAGGKLTTYRLMAEQTVDRVQRYLGHGVTKCITAHEPLLPNNDVETSSAIIPLEPSRRLVEHFCCNEWAVHLDDVMIRRSGWTHYVKDCGDLVIQVAGWMAEIMDWSETRKTDEIERYNEACAHSSKAVKSA